LKTDNYSEIGWSGNEEKLPLFMGHSHPLPPVKRETKRYPIKNFKSLPQNSILNERGERCSES